MSPNDDVSRGRMILFAWFLGVGILPMLRPRITPNSGVGPGGLELFDYLMVISLPIVAYIAGRRWFNGPLFLIYGALGMYVFVFAFLSDGRLGMGHPREIRSTEGDWAKLSIAVVFSAIICNFMGKMGQKSRCCASTENDASNG